VSWTPDGAQPTGIDLYFDPTVDEHVGHGPIGLILPAWYLAPQRREVAEAAWNLGGVLTGALDPSRQDIAMLDNPVLGVTLVQLAGEFADDATKQRIWRAADEHFQPTWDVDAGELTFGFGLDEEHPRGQWNARAMAGWACSGPGAWSDVFNRPNLVKFDEPTVTGVDFPRVALSHARWDAATDTLHVAAHPQNASVRDTRTTLRVPPGRWTVTHPDGTTADATDIVELTVDEGSVRLRRERGTMP
jgi:hypothetical protein